jgi:hypothetical protein
MTRDPAPTRVLVPAGRHHIVAEGDGWRAEADVEASAGSSAEETVTLVKPATSEPATPPPPVPSATASGSPPVVPPPSPSAPESPVSEGFVFGAQFQVIPHRFDKTADRPHASFGLAAGLMVEAGYAPAERFVLLGRLMGAAGSKGAPATTLGSIGVAFAYRVHRIVWLGAAFQGGRALLPGAINPAPDEDRRFDTDYVFCPSLEISIAVIERSYGQWLLSVFPGYYFASPKDNDLFYIPIGFGLRTF